MKTYTGWEWLLIDIANQYGHDKLTFEDRIKWAETNLSVLEDLEVDPDNKPLYIKANMAIRKAQQGIPTGHMVGVDACCSGIQIMSVLTGCVEGAKSTGLINPDVRADAYSLATQEMNNILQSVIDVSRDDAKKAIMTAFYGSKRTPRMLFGTDTPELEAFYQAATTIAPGAWQLLQILLESWQPFALEHSWQLPDGFDARIKVMSAIEARITVDELDKASFTYEFFENEGSKKGLSNAANVVHSVDAYVLRSMHRRCNYDRASAENAALLIEVELLSRHLGLTRETSPLKEQAKYYVEQYERSTVADIVILPYLTSNTIGRLSVAHLQCLMGILQGMLQYQPFELVTIHDEFKAHANNINWVRWQYKEILAEIAESTLLGDLISQVTKSKNSINKLSHNLGELIRGSNYALT